MAKIDIPAPICCTCGEGHSNNYKNGETFYLCWNCGTEMKYLPAGELLKGGAAAKKNNGWVASFSVLSSELYSARAMFVLGIVILAMTVTFLFIGKIGLEDSIWSAASGFFLVVIGKRKSVLQKKKTKMIIGKYPYWKK